ncbi:MAG: phage tail protein [Chelatococcus sp.]|nr:MAG: phage tail protein [Chelatococcus sp.]
MSTIYVQEAVNLFCGDDDPTKSKHLTIAEHKLPVFTEKTQDHHAGGSKVGIDLGLGAIEKFDSTFKLKGYDPDLLAQFGLGSKMRRVYTSRGLIRDKRTGRAIESKAIIEGRLIKIESDAFSRGEFVGHDYSIAEIMHYEFYFDGKEKVYWDFFTSEWRIDGVDENADERRILGISG